MTNETHSTNSGQTRTCQTCKAQFIIDAQDFDFYKKIDAPPPTLCPDCRFRRRSVFRNERNLYSRTCDLCKRSIVSMYNPSSDYIIYCNDCYYSDKWDPFSFGQEYNPQKPFFEQFGELLRRVPKATTYSSNYEGNINSEYINFAGGKEGLKNCYFIFNSGNCEEVMYSRGVRGVRETLDGYFGTALERCYEIVNVEQSAGIAFAQNAHGCLDSLFLLNCSGCQHCFGCVNLRHKTYHFFNEPLSKDEYEKRVNAIRGSYQKMQEARNKFEEFSLQFPRREHNNLKTVNSSGDYLFESKNVQYSFEADHAEDCKYIFSAKGTKDSYDVLGFGYDSELLLETVAVGYSSKIIGSCSVDNAHNAEYSFALKSCEYCIGCDGLRNAKYAILNTRYDETAYRKLRDQIIKELKDAGLYGLSLPPKFAPFAYNEAIGQDNLPLTKDEAVAQGFRWEENIQKTTGKETLKSDKIPDHINDVPESITNEVLLCTTCGRNYRIIKPELAFYKEMILPIPRQCFGCRHLDRIKRRGEFRLYERTCSKCNKPIKTTYNPNRPEIVYCEECYQREAI